MIRRTKKRAVRRWRVYTDGAIRPEQALSGLAVVVYDEAGSIALWWYRAAGKMTCNEAEYAAAIFALEQLLPFRPLMLDLYSDSQVMVRQMLGEAAVHAPALRPLHQALRERAAAYEQVTFHHVSREENRVADALANEAILRQARPDLRAKGEQADPCVKNGSTTLPPYGR